MKLNKKYSPPPITGWHIPAEFDCKYETSDPKDEKERSYVAFYQLAISRKSRTRRALNAESRIGLNRRMFFLYTITLYLEYLES
jgi:hypothetical protein